MKPRTVEAIPTSFNGIEYRSRLEAQMACLLDAMKFHFIYEVRSFMLPTGIAFTPDFWVPRIGLFIETRGYSNNRSDAQLAHFAAMVRAGAMRQALPEWEFPSGVEFMVVPSDGQWQFFECPERGGQTEEVMLCQCSRCKKCNFVAVDCCWQCRHCHYLKSIPFRTMEGWITPNSKSGRLYLEEHDLNESMEVLNRWHRDGDAQ